MALELNSSQSNPAVVVPAADEPGPDRGRIVSAGNFDTGPLAAALDDRATMASLTGWRLADMISLCARRRYRPGLPHDPRARPFTQADDTFPADLEPVVDLVTRGDLTPAA